MCTSVQMPLSKSTLDIMKPNTAVCVFCGASATAQRMFLDLAYRAGQVVAAMPAQLVFGGGGRGMMGALATGALAAGGRVKGIIPRFLTAREPPHPNVGDIHFVDTMHDRKVAMYAAAQAFMILPGGFGTLEEAFEVLTWRQLELHAKPIVFVGTGFWDGIEHIFQKMLAGGLLAQHDRDLISFVTSPEAACRLISTNLNH
jgi:uncharacterized protein (TIGR00730 family)